MSMPSLPRSSGVLLHPTSLPGRFGIGDLGPMAYRWVDTLAAMQQTWWQVLPLGPAGAGDSPYQSFSAFAGNVALLSPELLERDGLVSASLWEGQHFSDYEVDYPRVNAFKRALLRTAWVNFRSGRAGHLKGDLEAFLAREGNWLHDYSLYIALHDRLGGVALPHWPEKLLRRDPTTLGAARQELADEIGMHEFGQFLFDRQWSALKGYAAERGVKVLGDAPIFVSPDSADVWANPELFLLGPDLHPTVVAGVPPDYFSADGQLWGNPIYDWEAMEKTGYAWWVERLKRLLRQVDLIRLDHFRGFVQAWHIPAGETTARHGSWVDGPGVKFFERIRTALGGLPLLAEDLGLITPDVVALRDALGLPGMRVLQFALNGPDDIHWPHNFVPNTTCYTGTHDNETVNGWWAGLPDHARHYLGITLGHLIGDPAWELIRYAWSSVAVLSIAPMQDILSLGNEARMNRPGVPSGNWRWRFRLDQFHPHLIDRLREFTNLYNRIPRAGKI